MFFPGCSPSNKVVQKQLNLRQIALSTTDNATNHPTITVWVHGTQPSTRTLKFLHAAVEKPLSKINRELIIPHTHSHPGLKRACALEDTHYMRGIINTLCATDPVHYCL